MGRDMRIHEFMFCIVARLALDLFLGRTYRLDLLEVTYRSHVRSSVNIRAISVPFCYCEPPEPPSVAERTLSHPKEKPVTW